MFAFHELPDEALVGLHLLRDVAEECAFPELAFPEKPVVQPCVDVVHVVPRLQELLLQARTVLEREASEEAFQRLALVLVEVVEVLESLLVCHVGEDGFGVGKVLVDVVEVGHEHFAPAPELVDAFGIVWSEHFLHDGVELADALRGVGLADGRERQEEVAHGAVARCPDGFVAQERKLAAQEHAGTLAGKDNHDVAHVVREVLQHVGCNSMKERFHLFYFFTLSPFHLFTFYITKRYLSAPISPLQSYI